MVASDVLDDLIVGIDAPVTVVPHEEDPLAFVPKMGVI